MEPDLIYAQPLTSWYRPGNDADRGKWWNLAINQHPGRVPGGLQGTSWGPGIRFPNMSETAFLTAYGLVHDFNPGTHLLRQGLEFREFTWAAVLRHDTFDLTFRQVFQFGRQGVFINFKIDSNTSPGLRFTTHNGAHTQTAVLRSNDESASTGVRVACVQRSDGTKEIWQNGILQSVAVVAPSDFSAFPALSLYLAGGSKSSESMNGSIGGTVLSMRAWTPTELGQWADDPYGHYRPMFNHATAPPAVNPCDWFGGEGGDWASEASAGDFASAQGQQSWESEADDSDWASGMPADWFTDKDC